MINLEKIEQDYKQKIDSLLAKEIKSFARWSNWCGDLGFACDTYQAASRLKTELKALPDIGLIKLFRTGKVWETPNLQLIQNAGIKIVEQGRPFQWKEKQISGRIDAKIAIPVNGKEVVIPLEHKVCSFNTFREILKHKEQGIPLTKSRHPWIKKYPGQLQIYDLMDGSEYGMWFFYNKQSGDYFFWLYPLDLEYAESLVQRAERCNENVEKNHIPKPEYCELCDGCDFERTYCFPDKDYGPGFELLDEKEVEMSLERHEELKPLVKEYNDINKEIKGMFKGRNAVVGNFKLTSTERERKPYSVPGGKYWVLDIKKLD